MFAIAPFAAMRISHAAIAPDRAVRWIARRPDLRRKKQRVAKRTPEHHEPSAFARNRRDTRDFLSAELSSRA